MSKPDLVAATTPGGSVQSGPPTPLTPKWKRELRILRRDGLRRYIRGARSIRRFNRSVRRLP